MKKLMALCLTFIMVISMFTVAVSAATINVPAETVINGVFSGSITAIPDGWTYNKVSGGVEFTATGITAYKDGSNGVFGIYSDDAFNAPAAGYKFTATFKHHAGNCYIYFGLPSKNFSTLGESNYVSTSGYTLTASTSDYKEGVYKLYKDGELMGTIADPNPSAWLANKTPSFEFVVSSTGVNVTCGTSTATFEDATPIMTGYVGAYMQQQTADKNTSLVSMSLATNAYGYEVGGSEVTTGGYVVVGEKYVESHEGTLYLDKDLTGSITELPEGVTASSGWTGAADGIAWTGYPSKTVNFGTHTVTDDNFVVEARYSASPASNKMTFNFFGYSIVAGASNSKNITLSQGSTLLGEAAFTSVSNGTLRTVKAEFIDGKINVYVNDTAYITDVENTNPSKTGTVSIVSNYAGSPKVAWAKVYSADYKDTSANVEITKPNFILDKAFTNKIDTAESLAADGFSIGTINTINASAINYNGVNYGTGTVTYSKYTVGGAYTYEAVIGKSYNDAGIRFNYVDADNYYALQSGKYTDTLSNLKLIKRVGGTSETVVNVENLGWNTNAGDKTTFKVVLAPQEDGSLKIDYTLSNSQGTMTDTYTDATPVATSGKLQVYGSAAGNFNVYSMKAYPGTTAPVYALNFTVDGTTTADKGNTVVAAPVVMLGKTPDVIAALYEDGKMTDIKAIDIADLNENGYAQLFNTTQSKATNVNVKVFMWNSLAGMIPVTGVFALNN